jgi:hypothetical protein
MLPDRYCAAYISMHYIHQYMPIIDTALHTRGAGLNIERNAVAIYCYLEQQALACRTNYPVLYHPNAALTAGHQWPAVRSLE